VIGTRFCDTQKACSSVLRSRSHCPPTSGVYRASPLGVLTLPGQSKFDKIGPTSGLWYQTQRYGEANKSWLEGHGWTKTMIRKLLGSPDRTRQRSSRPNAIRWSTRPENLYSMQRVIDVENSAEFRAWQARLDRRRKRAADKADGLHFEIAPRLGRPILGWEAGVPRYARNAYNALSDRDKQIVVLILQHGKRQGEVASTIGVSQQTVSLVKTLFCRSVPPVPLVEDYENEDDRSW
jgi:hypothetical protein